MNPSETQRHRVDPVHKCGWIFSCKGTDRPQLWRVSEIFGRDVLFVLLTRIDNWQVQTIVTAAELEDENRFEPVWIRRQSS